MEVDDVRKQLWYSVDAKYQRSMLAVSIGMLCLCGASLGVLWLMEVNTTPMMTAMVCVVVLPLLVWQLWKLLRIFRKLEHYTLFRTMLSAPKGNRKVLAFPVTVPSGGQFWTDRIFYIRNLNPLLSDYLDKTVTVAWNRVTGRVIVIGK